MIKTAAAASLLFSVIFCTVLFLYDQGGLAISAFACVFVLNLNLLALFGIWSVVFYKKSIALGLSLIILKYPIIAYLIWLMTKQSWFNAVGVLAGLIIFIFGIFIGHIKRSSSAF